MLNKNSKLHISKNFLICIGVVCLIFTSFGLAFDDSFAADVDNETCESGLESSNIINSQDTDILEVDSQDSGLLTKEVSPKGNTFNDIQNCIDNAVAGDVIVLSDTYHANGDNEIVYINKKVTITSKSGAILDGDGKSGIFHVGSEGVVISNLKFINGYQDYGGALRIWAKNVKVENCVFEDNWGYNSGGAITTHYSSDRASDLKILNCNFTRNHANLEDFSRFSNAGAVGAYGKNTQIIGCIFDSNWAKSDIIVYGGALQIGMDSVDNNGLIDRCIFINNSAICPEVGGHGGAGCVRNGISYRNCLFVNNSANQGGALTFHASGNIDNCTFLNNSANFYGGAISSGLLYDTMVLNIRDCIFNGNYAPDGGAVQAIGLNIGVFDSEFTNNSASNCGGAVNIRAQDVSVSRSDFTGNTADVDGGAMYIDGINVNVENSSFISNHAIPDYDKSDDGLGGAIYVNGASTSISQNDFKYNTARNGSAIYNGVDSEDLILNNNSLFENQAWVYSLPISARNIYWGENQTIRVTIIGGNNIAKYNNLSVSNAIYNAAEFDKITIDGENPVSSATDSGRLYQDDREYNMGILLTVFHEDGTLIYNASSNSSYLGEITVDLRNLKPGRYYVYGEHYEDTYYKGITNVTSFEVLPIVDNKVTITTTASTFNYEDVVVWTLNITNLGPNNATEVVVWNVLPESLTWFNDTAGGRYDPKTGRLNIGDLNAGETLIYNIITVVEGTGLIVNEANVTAHETDVNLTNNYDYEIITVSRASDLEVIKTASLRTPNYHDYVTWTITVTNNGPDDAHDVVVYDILPESLIYEECDGDWDSDTGIWNIGELENGKSVKLTIRCLVNKTGNIQNNVTVNGSEFDYDLTNNHDEEIIYVQRASDLSVEKTVNASTVNYGDLVRWTLTVTNNGPDNAENVKVMDILPDGFVYVSSNVDFADETFLIPVLNVGETVVIEMISRVENTGSFVNYANVTSDEYDPDLSNNEDEEPISVNPASDLEVIKTVDEENPKYHENVTWTVKVINHGPDTAHNVVIRDLLPSSLIWLDDDSSGDYNPATGVLVIESLDVGEEFELNIECMVNSTGVIVNNVTVNATEYDYNITNNEDNETVDVEKSADVRITKLVNNTSPNYNDLVTWTLIIKNNGPDKATDIYVEDIIPEGLIVVDYTASRGIYNGAWVMCCLENGQEERLEIVTRVNRTGNITNIASIHAEEYDPDEGNNIDNESVDVPQAVDVAVVIVVNNTEPLFGEEVTWMITVVNNGPDNATGVVLNELLPDELIFIDSTSTKGSYSNGQWNIGSLNVGEVQYLNVTTVTDALGEILNNVNVKSEEYDWNMTNNRESADVNVRPVANLAVEKSVDNPEPDYGETVIWTLRVTNNGPNAAHNVKVSEKLPEGLKFVKSDGNYRNNVWNVGVLESGESKELNIVCKVTATGRFVNVVSVSGDEFDPDLNDNTDRESVDVAPASDLSVTKIASKYRYSVGDVVRYVIEVVNNGPDTAHNIKVSEIMDDLLKMKSFKVTGGSFDKFSLVWTIDSLGNGESARLYIEAIAMGAGILRNSVNVTSDTFDYNPDNNYDFAVVNVSDVENGDDVDVRNGFNGHSSGVLESHPTGNPFFTLILSLIFVCIAFSKRR